MKKTASRTTRAGKPVAMSRMTNKRDDQEAQATVEGRVNDSGLSGAFHCNHCGGTEKRVYASGRQECLICGKEWVLHG